MLPLKGLLLVLYMKYHCLFSISQIHALFKYTTGRLRPHFLDVCKPDWSSIDCSPEDNGGGLFPRYIDADEYRCEILDVFGREGFAETQET